VFVTRLKRTVGRVLGRLARPQRPVVAGPTHARADAAARSAGSDRKFTAPRRGSAFALLGVAGRPTTIGVWIAAGFRARLVGWLGRRAAPAAAGLWIVPCDGVHTFGMRFPIDLVFVDAVGVIRRVDPRVVPWRVRICPGARCVIELAAGRAQALGIVAGDRLEIRSV